MTDIRIFLADAAFLVREGIKSVVSGYSHLKVVGEATRSSDLAERLGPLKPDLVVLDYNAPGAFSLDDVRQIQVFSPESKLLVISSDLKKEQVLYVLECGVKGFLLKECDQTEIISAIHALAKNEKFFCGKVVDIILERQSRGGEKEACQPALLTERESEIVALMGEGLTTQQIADQLYLSTHTVYTHRKNIMRKLGVTSAAEVILYAVNSSLVKSR